jgi:hypothetical protein
VSRQEGDFASALRFTEDRFLVAVTPSGTCMSRRLAPRLTWMSVARNLRAVRTPISRLRHDCRRERFLRHSVNTGGLQWFRRRVQRSQRYRALEVAIRRGCGEAVPPTGKRSDCSSARHTSGRTMTCCSRGLCVVTNLPKIRLRSSNPKSAPFLFC